MKQRSGRRHLAPFDRLILPMRSCRYGRYTQLGTTGTHRYGWTTPTGCISGG